MTITEKALELHGEGFNCAQCVLEAFAEHTGLDSKTARAICSGLGGGVRCGEMCGALLGATIALGFVFPYTQEGDLDAATRIANKTKELTRRFKEEFGCVRCLDLKKEGVTCHQSIKCAIAIAEDIINNKDEE